MIKAIVRYYVNLIQWHTSRKIVVIESDDWGSTRVQDIETYRSLSTSNPALEHDPVSRYDSLESKVDLLGLFEALSSVKDSRGNPATITANTIMANPDFAKIKESAFSEYSFEKFPATLSRYKNRDKVMKLIHEGIGSNVYRPQFHGREHINVNQWLKALREGHSDISKAFDHGVYGIKLNNKVTKRRSLTAALDYESDHEKMPLEKSIREGLNIFEEIFGYKSKTFIAPAYIWDSFIEKELKRCDVYGLQGIPLQYQPNPDGKKYKRKLHYTGQKNKYGQIYLVRNAFFEPSLMPWKDVLGDCLKNIDHAFTRNKPAIIGSHRVNFMGSLDKINRSDNLILFKKLLKQIVNRWPEVEFLSSDELISSIHVKPS